MTHDVFISYATKDKPIADAVCSAVEARGFRCWIAPRDVLAGMPYGEAIVDAIQGSRVMVVVFSSNANASAHIPKEVERAATHGVTIMPLRTEDVLPAKSLDYFLASLHWLDALTTPIDPHLRRLADAIAQTLPKSATPTKVVAPPISRPTSAKIPEKERAGWWSGKAVMALAAVVLLAALAGAGWFYRSRTGGGGETIDSLAVLPFVNGSGDPKMEYLSDGISESLINSLSQLPNLKVMSRDSAFHYKGKDADAETVGRELGVRAVFKGRVTQQGENLDVSAELIDARDNSHIWGNQYNRKASDIFALQSDIAMEITSALRTRLTSEDENRITKSYTANPEAYQLYLQGRFWQNKRNEDSYKRAIQYFQQATEQDPAYALAYAGLADSYDGLTEQSIAIAPTEGYPKAKAAALKALDLDSSLAEVHVSLARIKSGYEWDWTGAEQEYRQAIALEPEYATAHDLYGVYLRYSGRLEEAIAEQTKAVELDPLSVGAKRDLAYTYYDSRQYDHAIEQVRKALELDPNYLQALSILGRAYLGKSMDKEAIAEFQKAAAAYPGQLAPLYDLGRAYALAGRRDEAQELIAKIIAFSSQKYVAAKSVAAIYAALGNKDEAFKWLEKAYQDRSLAVALSLKTYPGFDPLRSDPRFSDLLRRMNLQP